MSDIDLHDVLSRASEGQDAPELVHRALQTAKRRQARRHAGAAVAVATAVLGVVLVPPLAESSPDPLEEPPSTPDASSPFFPEADPATQPLWDPRYIETAPLRPTNLPDRIDLQTAQGPTLQDRPMSGVVAALRDEENLRLLDTDGTWRVVPLAPNPGAPFGVDDVARPSISSDSTRVAVATEAGIRVINVTTNDDVTIPWPDRFTPSWDSAPSVEWQPEDAGFIVSDIVRTWLVGIDGTSKPAPYRSYALGIDPDGPVYENDYAARTLVTWEGGQVADESPFVQCERIVAGYGMVACTAGSLQSSRSGPVVLDPKTGEILAYAPIKDPNAIYSDNGGLTLLGFLDEATLLMLVGPASFHNNDVTEERFLASWGFKTGEFQRISRGDEEMRSIAVAPTLVD